MKKKKPKGEGRRGKGETPVLREIGFGPHHGDAEDAARLGPTAIPLDAIVASPYQVRQDFDEGGLRELAATMAEAGLLQPIGVRPAGEGYELLYGERRLRAARLAGWTTIPAVLREDCDDATARRIVALENLQQKDLSAVEEARAFRAVLDGEPGLTQEQLAGSLGKSQPHVANRLRLLGLPESIQARVISGEIGPAQARALVPWCEQPAVAAILAAAVEDWCADSAGMPSAGELENELLAEHAVKSRCEEMQGQTYDMKQGRCVPVFSPTPEQRERLGIVTVACGWKKEQQVELATNRDLWKKLQAAHAARWWREHPAGGPAKGEGGAPAKRVGEKGEGKKEDAPERTPEERKEVARRRREQVKKWLDELAVNWLRLLLGRRILDQFRTTQEELLALLIEAATDWPVQGYHFGRSGPSAPKDGDSPTRAGKLLARCFWDGAEPVQIVPAARVRHWARELAIDIEAAWREEQLGPLSEALWKTLGKARCLEALDGVPDQKLERPAAAKAGAIIGELVAEWNRGRVPMPPELAAIVLPAKRGPKPKTKKPRKD